MQDLYGYQLLLKGTWEVKRPLENPVKDTAIAAWFTRISRVFELRCPGNVTLAQVSDAGRGLVSYM